MTKDTEITELDDQNESDYEIVEPEITLPEANDITVTGLPFTKFDQLPDRSRKFNQLNWRYYKRGFHNEENHNEVWRRS